jgi:hypothetical protein
MSTTKLTNGTTINSKPDEDQSDHPNIILYTNHGCGWSHRVSITIKEIGLPVEEVFIDMDIPRPEWFLKLNPVRTGMLTDVWLHSQMQVIWRPWCI